MSSNRIDKLTAEQEAALPKWRDMGIEIGLSVDKGEELNETTLRNSVDKVYANVNLRRPDWILSYDSPLAGLVATLELTKSSPDTFNKHSAVDYLAGLDINFADLDSLRKRLKKDSKKAQEILNYTAYGTQDIYWLTYYQFFVSEVGVELSPSPTPLFTLSKEVGWWWPLDRAAVITRKPTEIHVRDNRLHNPDGAAILYRDGFAVYAINGVRFTGDEIKYVTSKASEIDPQKVLGIRNVEQRSEIIRKIGINRMFTALSPKLLDRKTEHNYELYAVTVRAEAGVRKYLKMQNPSVDEIHLEAVHPDCSTVEEALVWRNTGKLGIRFDAPLALT